MTSSIKNYDFYRKAVDGLQTKSVIGGIISILSAIFISILTLSQLKSFIYPTTHTQLAIQDTLDLPVHTDIDIDFNQLSCDAIDIHFDNLKSNPPTDISIDKTEKGNGCHFVAQFNLYPGEGNFHFALSRPDLEFGTHSHLFTSNDLQHFNASHTINKLSFGSSTHNTLDSYSKNMNADFNHITYFLKLIRTHSDSDPSVSYQYSVTEYTRLLDAPSIYSRVAPGVFFRYQFYPIQINTTHSRTGFFQFY
ncbi:hypothetical protein WA538_006140, partial [Blastocystis sp. DL]